jgi:hypothetical protein
MTRDYALAVARVLATVSSLAAYAVGLFWTLALALAINVEFIHCAACLLGCLLFINVQRGTWRYRDQLIEQHSFTYKELYDEDIPVDDDDDELEAA